MQQKQSLQDQFVSYEIALKLKELEFDEPCLGYYSIIYNSVDQSYSGQLVLGEDPEYLICQKKMHYILGQNTLLAPLWQQAIDWLEQEYDILFGFLPEIASEYSHWGQEHSEIHTYLNGELIYTPKNRTYQILFWKNGKFAGHALGYGNLHECRKYAILNSLNELLNIE